jgi:hypothetical protein
MAMNEFYKSSTVLHPSFLESTIPFFPSSFGFKVKNMDKVDGHDADKTELIKLKFLMVTAIPASKYSQHLLSPTGILNL